MKFLNLTLYGSLLLSLNIGAMEQQPNQQNHEERTKKSFITLINKTEDSLTVVAKYFDESDEQHLQIEPEQKAKLSDMNRLERLSIVKYGKGAQYTNRSYFTFGLIQPYNVMQDQAIKDLIQAKKSAEVIVRSSGKEIVASLISYEHLQRLASYVTPYSFELGMAERDTQSKEYKFFLFDFFPRVKRAFRTDQPIHERYFLDLPEHANEHSVQKAYERKRDFWMQEQEKAQDPSKTKLAQDALKFVEAAYQSLSEGKQHASDFKTLIYNEDRFPTSYFFEEGTNPEEELAGWVRIDGQDESENGYLAGPTDQLNNNN